MAFRKIFHIFTWDTLWYSIIEQYTGMNLCRNDLRVITNLTQLFQSKDYTRSPKKYRIVWSGHKNERLFIVDDWLLSSRLIVFTSCFGILNVNVCACVCVYASWWFACLFAMFTNPIQMPMSDDLPKSLPLTCLNLNSMRKSCAFFLLLLVLSVRSAEGGPCKRVVLLTVFVASKTRTKSQQLKQFIMYKDRDAEY